MSKLTRGQLKDLVKECLVEILSEGLSKSHTPSVKAQVSERAVSRPIPSRAQSPALNSVTFSKSAVKEPQKNFESAVRQNVSLLTNDPVMSSIFSDTAATTLQEQITADVAPGQGMHSEMMSGGDVGIDTTDIFGDSSKNWAALAFADAPKK